MPIDMRIGWKIIQTRIKWYGFLGKTNKCIQTFAYEKKINKLSKWTEQNARCLADKILKTYYSASSYYDRNVARLTAENK